jgi:hypothetical protein
MRLRVLGCVLLSAAAVGSAGLQAPAAAAPRPAASTSETLKQQVAELSAEIDRVGAALAEGARAYEVAESQLGALTQQQFAARADREALLAAESESRTALQGLARAAYKGGMPPMVTRLLSGDPGALSQLAYVQRAGQRGGVTPERGRDPRAGGSSRPAPRTGARAPRPPCAARPGAAQALEEQRKRLAELTPQLTADCRPPREGSSGARAEAGRRAARAAEPRCAAAAPPSGPRSPRSAAASSGAGGGPHAPLRPTEPAAGLQPPAATARSTASCRMPACARWRRSRATACAPTRRAPSTR